MIMNYDGGEFFMKIKQLSIFLENKKGRLYGALNVLAEYNINICALTIADTSDFGILRLIVPEPKKAQKILEGNGFIVKINEVVPVEMQDQPGGLTSILKVLNDYNINLDYLYAVTSHSDKAMLLLRTEDLNQLIAVLKKENIPFFDIKKLSD